MALSESRPFDCSVLSDDDHDLLPCLENGPQWWQIGRQVAWSLGLWFLVVVTSPVLSGCWKSYSNQRICPFWVQQYVGTKFREAHNSEIEIAVCIANYCGSFCLLIVWIVKSYNVHHDDFKYYYFELVCVLLCLSETIFLRIKFNFSISNAFSLLIFIDCLTLPPLIMQRSGSWAGGSWLTLAYFRVYQIYAAIKRLIELKVLNRLLNDFIQQCILAVLECLVVVFAIAGTLFVMEGLGDIKGFSDQFFDSGMGEISFFQMVYFSFVTISTVGFGDFSPTTVLSRAFIIFAILGGVTFFSYISVHVVHLVELESSGRGKYYPSKKTARGHILVLGGGVTCGSQTVIETFMRALCRDDMFYDTPDIVMMGQTSCSKEVREMMKLEWTQDFRLQYFLGSPLNQKDMRRVRASEASMVFIISDFQAPDTNAEDNANSLIAAAVQETFPLVQYRLMLCSVQNLRFCSDIGLSEFQCFSLESFKAGMLGTSHSCPGFSTMILNLGLPILRLPNTRFSSTILVKRQYSKWLNEYAQGCALKLFGFHPITSLVGLSFKDTAIKISELTGVILIAAQIDGALVINPSKHITTAQTVFFGLGETSSTFFPISKNNDPSVASWIGQFQLNRKEGSFKHRLRSRNVYSRSQKEIDLLYESNISHEAGLSTVSPQEENRNHYGEGGGGGGGGGGGESSTSSSFSAPHIGGAPIFSSLSENFSSSLKESTAAGNAYGGGRSKQFIHQQQAAIKAKKRSAEMNANHRFSITTSKLDIQKLAAIVEQGGHTVIIMMEDPDDLDQQNVWEQLGIIIKNLIFAQDLTPMVIVHAAGALPSRHRFMKKYEDEFISFSLSFCFGTITDPTTLQAAGCHTCSRILTLSPSAPSIETDGTDIVVKSDEKMDETNIFLVKIFNQYQNIWKRNRRFRVTFDWYSAGSLNLLPIPLVPFKTQGQLFEAQNNLHASSSRSSLSSDEAAAAATDPSALMLSRIDTEENMKINSSSNSSQTISPRKVVPLSDRRPSSPSQSPLVFDGHGVKMSDDDLEFATRDPRGNCRFAAGDTIPKSFIAALYSMAYYTPGFLELIEALLIPCRYHQKSIPNLLKIPDHFFGQKYSVVARELLQAGTLPLGLLRPEGIEAGTPFPYVVTLVPNSDLIIEREDSIYLLADPTWANEEALKLGYSPYFEICEPVVVPSPSTPGTVLPHQFGSLPPITHESQGEKGGSPP